MPVITVNIPEAKGGDALQKSLLREFDGMRKQLQGMKDSDGSAQMLKLMLKQQDHFAKALERLFAKLTKMPERSDDLGTLVKGMKSAVSDLGDDLKSALVTAMKKSNGAAAPKVTVKPEVTVHLGGMGKKLDDLKDAIVKNGSRSRNRTFGSNY